MDLLNYLSLDSSVIREEFDSIIKTLRDIGLTEYEAKTYVALVALGEGPAEDIGNFAGIPRTSTYKVLRSLESKGFVKSLRGRPAICQAVDPGELKREIIDRISEVFDKLEQIKGVLSDRGTPQLVYTIATKEKVMAKIGEMLDVCRERFIISTPNMREIRQEHGSKFKAALKRGVKVMIITEPFVKVPPSTEVHRRSGLMATDVISDGRMALIAAPDLSMCGFTDNPFLVTHFENFITASLKRPG